MTWSNDAKTLPRHVAELWPRRLAWVVALAAVSVPLLAAPVREEWTPKFTFRPAAQAREAFLGQVKAAETTRTAGLKAARAAYVAALKSALESAITQSDLDEANRIKSAIETVSAGTQAARGAKTAPKRVVGAYEVRSGNSKQKNQVFARITLNDDFTCKSSTGNMSGCWYVQGDMLHIFWPTKIHDRFRVPPPPSRLFEGANTDGQALRLVPVIK